MDSVRRFIAVLLGWLTLAEHALPDLAPHPAVTTPRPVGLTIRCEGNIGGSGSDSGTAGGASGNPSDSGGGSAGGALSLPGFVSDLKPLADYVEELVSFASSPLQFLRGRAIPPILGAIFGFTFDLAEIVARPFEAISSSLGLLSDSLSTATAAITDPIGDALSIVSDLVLIATAPFGPLQPFAATALTLVIAYGVLVVGLRTLRAAADSIPILSGVETFLFG